MKRFLIETWGCQMNIHDSEKISGMLSALGYLPAPSPEQADLILLNTCSIREKAAEKIFSRLGQLRPLKRTNPDLLLGVCGCVAQQEGESIFRRAPYVDLVMGPRSLSQLSALLDQARRDGRSIGLIRDDEPFVSDAGPVVRQSGPRAYVTVMEGCNKSCTYCIVPYTRGREVYRSAAEILSEVRTLTGQGYHEVEFLGQNVNAYHHGIDDLSSLLRMADRVPGVRRLRFTTSHPGHLKRSIMNAMRDVPSVCNHLHLPVQSGSDRVLQRMRRGYTRALYQDKIALLRRMIPDIALSTDLIVGFPGETEDEFTQTLDLVLQVEFDQIYAFTFSPRPGTPAADFEEALPDDVKQERLARLFALQESIQQRRNQALIGRTFDLLLDAPSRLDGLPAWKGRTRCNRIVHVTTDSGSVGRFIKTRIVRAHGHSFAGEPISEAEVA